MTGDGALAQLGERVLCKHEVTGSIPVGSTKLRLAPPTDSLVARLWRDRLQQIARSDWQVHPTMSLPVRSRERDGKILTS